MEPNFDRKQRLHDLKGVHSNFRQVLELLRLGHRFSDNDRAEILKELENSLDYFSQELNQIEDEWEKDAVPQAVNQL